MTITTFELSSTNELVTANRNPTKNLKVASKTLRETFSTVPLEHEQRLEAASSLYLEDHGTVEIDNGITFPGYGHVFMPSHYFHSGLLNAGKKVSRARFTPENLGVVHTTQSQVDLPETLDQILDDHLETRMVKRSGSSLKEQKAFITIPSWKAMVQVVHTEKISAEQLLKAMMNLGSLIGLGDSRNFGLGRFQVEACESSI